MESEPDLLHECEKCYNNSPEWWGIDPEKADVFYRTPTEVRQIRNKPGESGGHMLTEFYKWLDTHGWNVVLKESEELELDSSFRKRYKGIVKEYEEFLKRFKSVISKDETTWFLCSGEYMNQSDLAFKWNEFELQSLEAAEDDEEWKCAIVQWWDGKLPIIMSVKGGYSFYAIDLKDNYGAIVRGEEPEYEETEIVASDLNHFFQAVISGEIEI